MLDVQDKSEIRRHLGYGAQARNFIVNDPWFAMNTIDPGPTHLEQVLDMLTPVDEAKLTGKAMGYLSFVGPEPTPGNSLAVTFTSEALDDPVTIEITAIAGDTKKSLGHKLSQAVVLNSALATAQIAAGGPYGPGNSFYTVELPQVEFKAPLEFTMALTLDGIAIVIGAQGKFIEPKAPLSGGNCGSGSNQSSFVYGYLPILNHLETLHAGASQRAHIARAEGYVRSNERKERIDLYDDWVQKLADFLKVPRIHSAGGGCGGFVL